MGTSQLKIPSKNPSEGYTNLPSRACCVVVEFLAGGTLKKLLFKNRKKKLAFKIVIQLALDLSRGWVIIIDLDNVFWGILNGEIFIYVSLLINLQIELFTFQEDCASWCQNWKYVVRYPKKLENRRFWSGTCWSPESQGHDWRNGNPWLYGPRGSPPKTGYTSFGWEIVNCCVYECLFEVMWM